MLVRHRVHVEGVLAFLVLWLVIAWPVWSLPKAIPAYLPGRGVYDCAMAALTALYLVSCIRRTRVLLFTPDALFFYITTIWMIVFAFGLTQAVDILSLWLNTQGHIGRDGLRGLEANAWTGLLIQARTATLLSIIALLAASRAGRPNGRPNGDTR
jgi:hypothetical protein